MANELDRFIEAICLDLEKVGSRYYSKRQQTHRLMQMFRLLESQDYIRLQEMPNSHLRVFLGERGRELLRGTENDR